MSAGDKAQLDWAKKQYGEDAAWRMYELQYNGTLQKSISDSQLANFQADQGGGGDVKGNGAPVSGNYSKEINQYAKSYGVEPNLVRAVAMQESSLGKASNNVMQVNGMSNSSPAASIQAGSKMLGNLLKKTGGNIKEALAAYNMGEGILSFFKANGGYSVANMNAFSEMQKKNHGYRIYGDPYYVEHVLRYYG
jgi:soluble lytic murein transglycosylase-like protein